MKKTPISTRRAAFLKGETNFKSVYDEHLIHREVYNPNKFSVSFQRNTLKDTYISAAGIPLGPLWAVCQPDGFLYLPHGYYIVKAENGAEIFDMLTNFGDAIGVGNKKASLPGI